MKELLKELTLINPLDLKLTSDEYGEFPDGYKLTESGIDKILKIITEYEKFSIKK